MVVWSTTGLQGRNGVAAPAATEIRATAQGFVRRACPHPIPFEHRPCRRAVARRPNPTGSVLADTTQESRGRTPESRGRGTVTRPRWSTREAQCTSNIHAAAGWRAMMPNERSEHRRCPPAAGENHVDAVEDSIIENSISAGPEISPDNHRLVTHELGIPRLWQRYGNIISEWPEQTRELCFWRLRSVWSSSAGPLS